jgi:hypothetical protein
MSRDRAVAAIDKYVSRPLGMNHARLIDNAMYAMLEYIIELEERLGVLETKPDPFAPIGRRGW